MCTRGERNKRMSDDLWLGVSRLTNKGPVSCSFIAITEFVLNLGNNHTVETSHHLPEASTNDNLVGSSAELRIWTDGSKTPVKCHEPTRLVLHLVPDTR